MNEYYRNRRVLVLGGLGFIGSNLALQLVECGAQVTLVDALIAGHGGNRFNIDPVRDRVRVHIADVRDTHAVESFVPRQDVVFNLAAQVSHVGSMRDPLNDLDINGRAHLGLLESCRRHNPEATIVFASTRQLYGRPQYLPVDEAHPIAPVDANGVSKRAAEMYNTLYHQTYGLRTVSLRLTNTYGPRMNLRGPAGGFICVFLKHALTGRCIELFGGGEQRRDFNYVDDVVSALLLAGEREGLHGQAFNLGHEIHHSLVEFVHLLQRHTPIDCRAVPFPRECASIDVGDCYCSFKRFREAAGWAPHYDLGAGLAATMEFFQKHRTHYLESDDDTDLRLAR